METVSKCSFIAVKMTAPVGATSLFLQFVPLELNLSGLSTEIMHHSLLSKLERSKYICTITILDYKHIIAASMTYKSRASCHIISFHLFIQLFIHSFIRVIIYLFIYFQITIVVRFVLYVYVELFHR